MRSEFELRRATLNGALTSVLADEIKLHVPPFGHEPRHGLKKGHLAFDGRETRHLHKACGPIKRALTRRGRCPAVGGDAKRHSQWFGARNVRQFDDVSAGCRHPVGTADDELRQHSPGPARGTERDVRHRHELSAGDVDQDRLTAKASGGERDHAGRVRPDRVKHVERALSVKPAE